MIFEEFAIGIFRDIEGLIVNDVSELSSMTVHNFSSLSSVSAYVILAVQSGSEIHKHD